MSSANIEDKTMDFENQSVICSLCSATFTNKYSLQRHERKSCPKQLSVIETREKRKLEKEKQLAENEERKALKQAQKRKEREERERQKEEEKELKRRAKEERNKMTAETKEKERIERLNKRKEEKIRKEDEERQRKIEKQKENTKPIECEICRAFIVGIYNFSVHKTACEEKAKKQKEDAEKAMFISGIIDKDGIRYFRFVDVPNRTWKINRRTGYVAQEILGANKVFALTSRDKITSDELQPLTNQDVAYLQKYNVPYVTLSENDIAKIEFENKCPKPQSRKVTYEEALREAFPVSDPIEDIIRNDEFLKHMKQQKLAEEIKERAEKFWELENEKNKRDDEENDKRAAEMRIKRKKEAKRQKLLQQLKELEDS